MADEQRDERRRRHAMAGLREVRPSAVDFGAMTFAQRVVHAGKALLGLREVAPAGANTYDEDLGFRRITSRSDKELQPAKWQKQMRVAHFLWQQNPMAYRMLELVADFVIGDGFTIVAKDEEVQKVLDRHWNDPDNAWEVSQFDRYMEAILFGTFCMRAFVNQYNGHVKVSAVDPSWISEVVGSPDIAGKAIALRVQRGVLNTPETWTVIGEVKDVESDAYGLLDGQAFYFGLNKLSFTLHGISDLFRIADWVDAFDQFVFSLLERINFLNAHIYDITLEDAEDEDVKEKVKDLELNPPKPGGFRVHNQREKWEALAPKINSSESEEIARMVRLLILGSMGIPDHWFGEGGDVNRATAEAMAPPTLRKMRRKQGQWATILRTVCQFQIDQAVKAGRLQRVVAETGEPRDLSFEVQVPELSVKDVKTFWEGVAAVVDTMAKAVAAEFITAERAAEVVAAQVSETGLDVKPPTEDERAAAAEKIAAKAKAALQKEVESMYGRHTRRPVGKNGASSATAHTSPGGAAAASDDGQPAHPAEVAG